MENRVKNQQIAQIGARLPARTDQRRMRLRDLVSLSGSEMLNRILSADSPHEFISKLPCEDFFWLVKKVGENDSLALLELASADQWQYLLDLELWKRDRLDVSQTSHWLRLLQQADCRQLVKWLFVTGEYLAYYHFSKTLEVVMINTKDEILDLPDGFFSLDGVFYIRVIDPEYRESIENIIHVMADENHNKYKFLLLRLANVLPAEVEEEMYRLRNLRLAEHGFLPHKEAIAVYSPLDPAILKTEVIQALPNVILDEETRDMVPVIPLAQTETSNLFMDTVSGIRDPLFLDRLRLEFAGLANQILSADGIMCHEIEDSVEACKKAARIVNLAIERACDTDLSSAEKLLKLHSLVSLFRVGFGMALKLKWEAERWFKKSWFYRQELNPGFWGEHWGGVLKGLLAKRPRYYVGSSEKEEYRDFEWLSDLGKCLEILRGLMVLDGLLERLTVSYRIKDLPCSTSVTCYSFLFNLWGRLLLKLGPSFSGISLGQARDLLGRLRKQDRRTPYRMPGFETVFINDFLSHAANSDPEAASILEKVLSQMWKEFQGEYKLVSISDLDARYSKFLTIEIPR